MHVSSHYSPTSGAYRLGRHRRRTAAVTAIFGAASVLVSTAAIGLGSASSATTSPKINKSHAIKANIGYFAGKTISYIVANSPGTAPGEVATAEAPFIASYLHATVNVSYIPAGGGVVGQDTALSAQANGLTLTIQGASVNANEIFSNRSNPYTFDLTKIGYVGATFEPPSVIVSCSANSSGAGINSFNQLVSSKPPASWVITPGGNGFEISHVLSGAYNLPATFVTGYGSAGQVEAGCLRGDGSLSVGPNWASASGTSMTPGSHAIVETGRQPGGSGLNFLNQQIPTFTSLLKSNPPKTKMGKLAIKALINQYSVTSPGYVMETAANTPRSLLLALQQAVKYALSQGTVKGMLLQQASIPPGAYPADKLLTWIKKELKYTTLIRDYVPAS